MKLIKALSWICFLAVAVALISTSPALAGAGPEPPDPDSILPGEVWGVVVLICTVSPDLPDYAVVRVKRITNCEVEVDVHVDPLWAGGCPVSGGPVSPEDAIKNWDLSGIQFFGNTTTPIIGTPYIDSVRNFAQTIDAVNNTSTFDAKFKFFQ